MPLITLQQVIPYLREDGNDSVLHLHSFWQDLLMLADL